MREVVNALLDVPNTGCPWRFLPEEFPPRSTVHGSLRQWQRDGDRPRLRHAPVGLLRDKLGRGPSPSAAVLDRRSARSGPKGGAEASRSASMPARRSRAASAISGPTRGACRARSSCTAPPSRIGTGRPGPAHPPAPPLPLDRGDPGRCRAPRPQAGGRGRARRALAPGDRRTAARGTRGVQVQPRRGVIERSFGWLSRNRRLARDFEGLGPGAGAFGELASLQLLLRRLATA